VYLSAGDFLNELLARLRQDDPSALEELGHRLLPFVQASALAHSFTAPDAEALLKAFREEVATAARTLEGPAFEAGLRAELLKRARAVASVRPDLAQSDALSRLARLAPLPVEERELAIARFVERLPVERMRVHFGLELPALTAALARAATLLVGPSPGGVDWSVVAALLDPDGDPIPGFIELENAVGCLAIDVTAIERHPTMAPLPVLKPGFEPAVPQAHYPSKIATQGFVDLPADVSRFGPAPVAEPPPLVAAVPPVEITAPVPGVAPKIAFEEPTVSNGTPLKVPDNPLWADSEPDQQTEIDLSPAKPVALPVPANAPPATPETTEPRGVPLAAQLRAAELKAMDPNEPTAVNAKKLNIDPSHLGARRPKTLDEDGKTGYFAEIADDATVVRALPLPKLPFFRRLSARWWFGASMTCAALGLLLYSGFVSRVRTQVHRPWTLVSVIVAARDLPEGTRITEGMLSTRAVPEVNVSTSVVRPEGLEYAISRTLEFPLQAGDPLLWSQFNAVLKNRRLEVAKHGRAYTIPVSDRKSLGGMLVPGDEIDLVLSFNPGAADPKAKPQPQAVTLLQRVRLLSVNAVSAFTRGETRRLASNLTLLLVPEEVEVLSLGRACGELTATLRNAADEGTIPRGDVTTQAALISGLRLKALSRKRGTMVTSIRSQQH
jgi:pilus assembly protein CpaB